MAKTAEVRGERPNLAHWRVSAFMRMAVAIFLVALLGIVSRPSGFLAALWPANAVMLGLLLRSRQNASVWGWLGAITGYLAADLVTGSPFLLTLWLTWANLAGVGVGYLLFFRLSQDHIRLRKPAAIYEMFTICAVAALSAALSSLAGRSVKPSMFSDDVGVGLLIWATTEFVNYVTVLPVILAAPSRLEWLAERRKANRSIVMARLLPGAALGVSLVAGVIVGGPGAIAISIPALVWCAFSYPLFAVAITTVIFSMVHVIVLAKGSYELPLLAAFPHAMTSLRLGLALVSVVPLTIAALNSARNELLKKLDRAASHDALTDTLGRRAFFARAESLLAALGNRNQPGAVIMLDVDHFKSVNDQYGHAGGDQALVAVAAVMRENLRKDDLLGRLGGEEFAMILPNLSFEEALVIAERIRNQVAQKEIELTGGLTLQLTVSQGVSWCMLSNCTLEELLADADRALYKAKHEGRNKVFAA